MITKRINKKFFKVFELLILLFVLLVSLLPTITQTNTNQIECNNDKEAIKTKKKLIDMKIDKNENIVLFGDSITEIYPIDEIYGDLPIVKSGVSGYKTTNLLEKMNQMLYQYNPTKVILLIGINDVLYDDSEKTQNETIQNIQEIVKEIQKYRPKSKIYIESIYPVNKSKDKLFDFNIDNDTIRKMNKRIKEYCKEEKITYINLYDELTDKEGNFDERYTYDGLHPSTLGYAKITRILLPYIYE